MKTLKAIGTTLLASMALIVLLLACQQDAVHEPKDVIVRANPMMGLVELGQKMDPSEEEITRFSTSFAKLSLEELVQYRQAQHEVLRKEHGNTESVNQQLEADLAWWKQVHKESIREYGKPLNQVDAQQQDQVFTAMEQPSAKGGRKPAACPPVTFNSTFQRGFATTNFLDALITQEVNEDCDCQLNFVPFRNNFRWLRPKSAQADNLFRSFGTVGGRRNSSGQYPVFGTTRVNFWFPGFAIYRCNVILRQYSLSSI